MNPPLPTSGPGPSPGPGSSSPGALTAVPAALPSPSSFSPGPIVAGLFLAGLAAAALVMVRRRSRAPRLVEIVESASLGPRRSLVVARLGDEILLLGSSEGGIALLSTRPAAGLVREPAPEARPLSELLPSIPRASPLLGLLSRIGLRPRGASTSFDTVLTESLEDVELRRKLAQGLSGRTAASPRPGSAGAGPQPRGLA